MAEIAPAERAQERRRQGGRAFPPGAGDRGDPVDLEGEWDDGYVGSGEKYEEFGGVTSSSVPYSQALRFRPRRRWEIEQVNLFLQGEYEEVVPGWANLATAAQYELEYLLPLVGTSWSTCCR
eukprot:SAG22_NODE_2243_length_2799_cov_3.216296_1_plen_122_part_00